MNVKQLIEILQTLDPEMSVFTRGYEGGFDDIDPETITNPIDVALDVHDDEEWWNGRHEQANVVEDKSKYKIVKSIII